MSPQVSILHERPVLCKILTHRAVRRTVGAGRQARALVTFANLLFSGPFLASLDDPVCLLYSM